MMAFFCLTIVIIYLRFPQYPFISRGLKNGNIFLLNHVNRVDESMLSKQELMPDWHISVCLQAKMKLREVSMYCICNSMR